MDRLVKTKLDETLRGHVASYAGPAETKGGLSEYFFVDNPEKQVYCIVAPYNPDHGIANLLLMARIVDDKIIIDVDKFGDPLVGRLQESGIPDEQIIVAWRMYQ